MVQVVKTKTRKGKRVLDDRASKTVENDKIALFVKGNKTTEDISEAMKDLYLLKKPLVQKLDRLGTFNFNKFYILGETLFIHLKMKRHWKDFPINMTLQCFCLVS